MPEKTDFLAVLVIDRGDGWANVQPHVFAASHPEIAYRLALAKGEAAPGSQQFVGLAELSVSPPEPPTTAEMVRDDPTDLVKAKDELQAFQDPRWHVVPFDRRELRDALRGPVITHEPKDLESVRWDRLEHAYGSAQDVPVYLRSLGAEDAEIRGEALGALLMTIFHQGSLYSATVATLPFLLRLIEVETHPARLETMDLVRMIVNECCFSAYRERKEASLAAGEDPQKGLGDEPDLVGAIAEILGADIDLLERLRSDEDPYIRDMSEDVLRELKGESHTL
jgi:hypothetical protein